MMVLASPRTLHSRTRPEKISLEVHFISIFLDIIVFEAALNQSTDHQQETDDLSQPIIEATSYHFHKSLNYFLLR